MGIHDHEMIVRVSGHRVGADDEEHYATIVFDMQTEDASVIEPGHDDTRTVTHDEARQLIDELLGFK